MLSAAFFISVLWVISSDILFHSSLFDRLIISGFSIKSWGRHIKAIDALVTSTILLMAQSVLFETHHSHF